MQTTSFKALSFLSILLFCSCSDITDTAQAPEMAPAASQASQRLERVKEVQPASALLQSSELFGTTKSKDSEFAEDLLLLQSQDGLGEIDTGEDFNIEQGNYSQDLIP